MKIKQKVIAKIVNPSESIKMLELAKDFELVREKYINVIENTGWTDFLFYEMNIYNGA